MRAQHALRGAVYMRDKDSDAARDMKRHARHDAATRRAVRAPPSAVDKR